MVAALVGAVCFLLLTDGGRLVRQAEPLVVQLDWFAERIGLGFKQASVSGHRMTSSSDIFKALRMGEVRSLLRFDSAKARERIEALPWVARANVLNVLPNRVEVRVRERLPFAAWRSGEQDILVDRTGRVLSGVRKGAIATLPVIVGRDAPLHAGSLLEALGHYPSLLKRIVSQEWVGRRRWSLHLETGQTVHLPEKRLGQALKKLCRGKAGHRLLDVDFRVLDLRDLGQFRVRLRAGRRGGRLRS